MLDCVTAGSSSCMFGTVVAMSTLVVFGRKMIFIGCKLGQWVIIDLLCCGCCSLRFDLVSLLYIWSLFRSMSEQAVSAAWIVSLQGRDHIVMLCSEQGTGESCLGNKGCWWAQVGDPAPPSGCHGLESTCHLSQVSFLDSPYNVLFILLWNLILFYF